MIGALNAQIDQTKNFDSEESSKVDHEVDKKKDALSQKDISEAENRKSQEEKDLKNGFVLKSSYLNKKMTKKELNVAFNRVSYSIDSLKTVRKNSYFSRIDILNERMGDYLMKSKDKAVEKNIKDNDYRQTKEFKDMKGQVEDLKLGVKVIEEALMLKYRELQYLKKRMEE